MADDIHLDPDDLFRQVNDSPQLRAAVRARATKIAARARTTTAKEGGSARIGLRERVLDNGRYSMDVTSDSADEEFGTSETTRIRALRSAARSVR